MLKRTPSTEEKYLFSGLTYIFSISLYSLKSDILIAAASAGRVMTEPDLYLSMFLEFDPDKMGDYYLYVDTSYKLPDYRQGATISRIIIESGSNTLEITETNELDLFGRDFIEATADEKPSFVVDEAVEYYPIYFYYQDCKARYYYGLYSITENGTIYFSCNDVDSEKLYKSSQSVNSILKEKGLI